jgi:hypothetical protein
MFGTGLPVQASGSTGEGIRSGPFRPAVGHRFGRTPPFSTRNVELRIPEDAPSGIVFEPLPGLEPGTPSLPWKCSTAELKRHCAGSSSLSAYAGRPWSGRRDSNSRPSAWKADARPTELLPLAQKRAPRGALCGRGRIRTSEVERHWIYSPARLTASVPVQGYVSPASQEWPPGSRSLWSWQRDSNPRPADYKSAALPAELCQQAPHAWPNRGFWPDLKFRVTPLASQPLGP